MAETKMSVKLLAHTQLSESFFKSLFIDESKEFCGNPMYINDATDGQAVALSAIRTCYSPNKPSEIVALEGEKYFGNGGTEAARLFRQIVRSKHTSTLEHLSFTFAIEGVSRALLAQLTRHRVGFSFSVQSQRYVRFGSVDRSGGFEYVVPDTVKSNDKTVELELNANTKREYTAEQYFELFMQEIQEIYDNLRKLGVPAEDARAVLPQATATNLVMTVNLRSLLDFYEKRKAGNGAQAEIGQLAEELRKAVVEVEPWAAEFFEGEAAE